MNFKPGDCVLISTNITRTNKYYGENLEKSTYAGKVKEYMVLHLKTF